MADRRAAAVTAPADAGSPGHPTKSALPAGALTRFTTGRRQAPSIPARPAGAPVPLTPIQQRLWLLEQTGQGGATYLTWMVHRLSGPLDRVALAESMWHLVERHEALRVGFEERDGRVWQVVADGKDLDLERMWEFVDLTGVPEPGREQRARDHVDEFLTRGYDLTNPPLMRATLVRFGADEHVLAITLHHIICDGTASGVLGRELFARYQDLIENKQGAGGLTSPPSAPAVSFLDYAAWLADRGSSEADRDYWRTHLDGAPALLRLPTDRPAPLSPNRSGDRYSLPLDQQLSDALREVAKRERCTLFSVLLAAYSATLVRFGAEEDLVLGAPADTRERPELASTVGMFANTVALRTDLRGNPRLSEVIRRAARSATDGLDHATYPFDAVVELLQVPRDRRHNPLVQAMLVVGAGDSVGPDLPAGLSRGAWPLPSTPARFDLTLVVTEGQRLELHFDYPTAMFDASTIARFGAGVRAMMRAFTATPQHRLWEVPVVTDAQASLVIGGAGAETIEPKPPVVETELPAGTGTDGAVVERILHHARRAPAATALVDGATTLTYEQLVRRAYALSSRLAAAGAGSGDTVGVLLPSGADAIVAILATLRIGAAYLPLDPAHPRERVIDLLEEAGAAVVVTADGAALPGRAAVAVTSAAAESPERTLAQVLAAGWHRPRGVEPAYAIFTSGSTGRPKGVVITHATLARFTDSFIHAHGFHSATRLLMLPPVTFDASVGDIFPALAGGGALVFHPEPARLDGAELLRFCDQHGVTVVDAPVALWRSWVEQLTARPPSSRWPVRMMMVGGDRVPVADLRAWVAATGGRISLVNHYGPTEATVCATICDAPLERFDAGADADGDGADYLPIGRPLPHVRVYLLDWYGNPVPAGVAGEVYLGGDCLAQGYLSRPGLTAQRFLPDPYAPAPGARMYRTGDLARLRTDGELEFLGRVDRQLKINGYRVEPAEAEAALSAHPWVEDAAVVARQQAGRTALVAYVAGPGEAPADLRGFLRQRLPDYLVPASYVAMQRLPRTSHGKLDEAALPPPSAATDAPPPEGQVETAIAAIWQRALGADRVGRTDNFFDLGGHSLLAAGVLAQVQRELGVELPLRSLFETADLAELASMVAGQRTGAAQDADADAEEVDLFREAELPAELGPARPARALARAPRAVLVTGSTGFLGAHLVRELLTRTEATVWCLARADDAAGAAARVIGALRRQGYDPDLDRIVGVPGELTAPDLGRSASELAELAEAVDVICHNGGVVNFAEPYSRLKPANVDGTREVLKLALRPSQEPIPIHFVSTLGVFLTGSYLSSTVPENLAPDDPSGLHDGYNQSKWVADAMLRAARERGVPISVHRPARVGGHSTTGHSNPDDYFCRLLATCAQVGMVPDLPYREDLAPVDYVAAGIAHLATTPGADLADHHYFNRTMISYPEIAAALTGHGCPVELVEWGRWRRAVLDGLAAGDSLALAPFVVSLPEQTPEFPRPEFDCSVTEGLLREAGITCPPADPLLLGRQLRFLTNVGRLGAPQAESREATG